DVGETIHAAVVTEVDPDGQLRRLKATVTRRNSEEQDLLPRREDAVAEDFRKHLAEPRAARENKRVGRNRFPLIRENRTNFSLAVRSLYRRLPVNTAVLHELLDYGVNCLPGHQRPALRLIDRNGAALGSNLRIPAR